MNILNKVYSKSFHIATTCLLVGFLLMAFGNTSFSASNSFLPLTLAPCLLITGYSFIVVGIMKRKV